MSVRPSVVAYCWLALLLHAMETGAVAMPPVREADAMAAANEIKILFIIVSSCLCLWGLACVGCGLVSCLIDSHSPQPHEASRLGEVPDYPLLRCRPVRDMGWHVGLAGHGDGQGGPILQGERAL